MLIKFNIKKCVVMHYEHYNKKDHFFIYGIQLKVSDSKRDLGVIFSTDLKVKNKVLTDGECNVKQLISELFINENL